MVVVSCPKNLLGHQSAKPCESVIPRVPHVHGVHARPDASPASSPLTVPLPALSPHRTPQPFCNPSRDLPDPNPARRRKWRRPPAQPNPPPPPQMETVEVPPPQPRRTNCRSGGRHHRGLDTHASILDGLSLKGGGRKGGSGGGGGHKRNGSMDGLIKFNLYFCLFLISKQQRDLKFSVINCKDVYGLMICSKREVNYYVVRCIHVCSAPRVFSSKWEHQCRK